MKDLEVKFKTNLKESSKSRYQRRNHSNSSFDYKEIKLPNIPLFNFEFSIKQQNKWLINLQQMFKNAKKKYKKDKQKILKMFISIVPEYKVH